MQTIDDAENAKKVASPYNFVHTKQMAHGFSPEQKISLPACPFSLKSAFIDLLLQDEFSDSGASKEASRFILITKRMFTASLARRF